MELDDEIRWPSWPSWVADGGVVVLSGAGLSTESGIPDYRGPSGAARRATPMTYQAFTRDPVARRRYWARSHLGWRTIGDARPNAGHRAVARLQELAALDGIITQNVDGLHQAGGAGTSSSCTATWPGSPAWTAVSSAAGRAGGPAGRGQPGLRRRPRPRSTRTATWSSTTRAGRVHGGRLRGPAAGCSSRTSCTSARRCRRSGSAAASSWSCAARTLLVLGSSLTVMSGRRFVLRAAKDGIRVAIVNQGVTRGEPYAAWSWTRRSAWCCPSWSGGRGVRRTREWYADSSAPRYA